MARILQFFQLLLAEVGAARRRVKGWSGGVVLLVLVLGEVHTYVCPLLVALDAGKAVEVLARLAAPMSSLYMSNARCKTQAGESKLGDPWSTETANKHTFASKSAPLT
jgi:hypothetical protein